MVWSPSEAQFLTENKSDYLTPLIPIDNDEGKKWSTQWVCLCTLCNSLHTTEAQILKYGFAKTCGCLKRSGKRKDLKGQTFGFLKALYREPDTFFTPGSDIWICQCYCGKKVSRCSRNLLHKNNQSCGCRNPHTIKNIAGERYNRLKALYPVYPKDSNRTKWACKCTCGAITRVGISSLQSGHTKSCGCLYNQMRSNSGISKTPGVPEDVWKDVLNKHGTKCVKCGTSSKNGFITCDHIIPKSKGGGNNFSNLQPLCYKCNLSKGDHIECFICEDVCHHYASSLKYLIKG